ncbi:uncharacterized protein LOC112500476 [Cynara cardunculus var. scolymus]|nr:uncharacterized protein LOC112500476 [Cynara cardunculus var. scolymus]
MTYSGLSFFHTSNILVQVAQGNETGANVSNHGQSGNQSQPRSPSQSMPQGLQNPLAAATIVPTLATPIPDSLNTLSKFINRMEQALSQNAYQPNHPSVSTEGIPAVELPSNGHGLLSPTALAVVLRRTQRLLSGPAIDSLSHTAGRLEEEEHTTNVTVRTQIQTEAMQSGIAMQHLGALLLELGHTMLTLRIGRSHVTELRDKLSRVEEELETERKNRADLEARQAASTVEQARQAAFMRQSGYVFPPPPDPDS